MPRESTFSTTPLSFDAASPGNAREYLHKPYIVGNCSHCATSLLLIGLFYSNFLSGLRKRMCFETECEMAVQGYPKSLILVPIESTYATSYYRIVVSSNLGPIFPCFRDIAGLLLRRVTPPLFNPNFGVFPLNYIANVVAQRSECPKLIIRVITVEPTQHIRVCPIAHGTSTNGRTDDLL